MNEELRTGFPAESCNKHGGRGLTSTPEVIPCYVMGFRVREELVVVADVLCWYGVDFEGSVIFEDAWLITTTAVDAVRVDESRIEDSHS